MFFSQNSFMKMARVCVPALAVILVISAPQPVTGISNIERFSPGGVTTDVFISQSDDKRNPNSADYIESGNDNFLQKNKKKAIEDYDEALRLKPNDPVAYYNRCFAKLSLGMQREALNDCDKAIGLSNNFSYAYFVRGKIHLNLKEKWAAMDDLLKAAELFRAANNTDLAEEAMRLYRYSQCPLC